MHCWQLHALCTLLTDLMVVGVAAHGHKLEPEGIVASAGEALVMAPAGLRWFEAGREIELHQSLLMRPQITLDERWEECTRL